MNKIGLKQNRNKEELKISQTLVIRPPSRSPQAIDKWRAAVRAADFGRRHSLIEKFNDLMDDPVLGDAIDKRIRNVTNANLVFQKDGKEEDSIWSQIIDTLEFEDLVREIMLTKFYGKTIIELDFTNGFDFTSIDRRHLNTKDKVILKSISDTDGIPYDIEDDFIINLGKDNDLGLFMRTAPYAIFKRNGGSDFAEFCELFGIPQLAGYYDPDDDNGRREMEAAFQKRGSAASMTMSNKSKIESIATNANGNVDVHDRFLDWCDEQILIAVLSQTMTTKDGSSYSQGKVHGDTEDDLNYADRMYVQRVLNTYLIPRLEKRGYPVTGGYFNYIDKDKKLTPKEKFDIAIRMDDKHPIDEDWWYEEFGFPKAMAKRDSENKNQNDDKEELKPNIQKEPKKVKAKKGLGFDLKNFFGNAPQ